MIRRLPGWSQLVGGILAAVLLAWAIDRVFDFADARVGETLSFAGVLVLAAPAFRLNTLARQRKDLDELVKALSRRSKVGLTARQQEDATSDIDRLTRKIEATRATAQDWTPGAEAGLVAGYFAILTASIGRLVFG